VRLELDNDDLKREFRNISPKEIRFFHFKKSVQSAIDSIGKAIYLFREWPWANVVIKPPRHKVKNNRKV